MNTLTPQALAGKVVLIRVDMNVPLKDSVVTETTRIEESIPTIKFALDAGASRVHIITHLGRPKGEAKPEFSVEVLAPQITKFLGETVEFNPSWTPTEAKVQLHENTRFSPGEKKNDPAFVAQMLQTGAEVFIFDAFAVAHRAHASVVGLGEALPVYPGLLMKKEIEALSPFLSDKKVDGLCVITGGAKLETKVQVLKRFAITAENILVGGALATTFLAAEGFDVAESFYQPEQVETAQEVLGLAEANGTGFHIPVDVICADDIDSEMTMDVPVEDVCGDMKIFDLGPHTVRSYEEIIAHSKVIIWNGPLGVIEKEPFKKATGSIATYIAAQEKQQSILGGGDTLAALQIFDISKDKFTHVSTGGGAMLEFLEGKQLPGIAMLG